MVNEAPQLTKQADIDALCRLPNVGPATAETLQDQGYGSFYAIAKTSPMALHRSCDIVLSATTRIIGSAIDELEIICPNCSTEALGPIWQAQNMSIEYAETESDVFCNSCFWHGEIEDVKFKESGE